MASQLDPRIPLEAVAGLPTPEQEMALAERQQQLQEKNRLLRQQALDDAALRKAVSLYPNDPAQASTWLKTNNFAPVAQKLDAAVTENRDKLSQAAERETTAQIKRTELMRQTLNGVKPEDWEAVAPSILAALPGDDFQKSVIAARVKAAKSPDEALSAVRDGLTPIEQYYKIHEAANKAQAEGQPRKAVGYRFMATHSEDDYQGARDFTLKYGDPDQIQAMKELPEHWTPDLPGMAAKLTIEPEKQAQLDTQAKAQERIAADAAANLAIRQRELAIQQGHLDVSRAAEARQAAGVAGGVAGGEGAVPQIDPNAPHGDDYLKTLPPNQAAMVKSLAEGRQPWPASFALRTPYWQDLINRVMQYDPTMDTATINNNARAKTRADFTSGKSAQQINALNTVVGHVVTLNEKMKDLGNTSATFVNWAKNALSQAAGQPQVTSFETAKEAVASELVRVWRQAGGAEADIKAWKDQLSSSASPQQLKAAMGTIGDLLESKLESMQNQYQQGMGTTPVNIITPEARANLDRIKGTKSASKPPQNPKVGDTWQSPKGLATWDGSSWIVKGGG